MADRRSPGLFRLSRRDGHCPPSDYALLTELASRSWGQSEEKGVAGPEREPTPSSGNVESVIAGVPIGAKIRSALNRFVVWRGMRAPVQAAFIVRELFLITASIGCTPHFQSGHYRGRLSDKARPPGQD